MDQIAVRRACGRPHAAAAADHDDVGLNVLECWVDILETNCNKTLKTKD